MTLAETAMLLERRAWNLDACLKCSLCVEHCPVVQVSPSFPGPKALGPDSERWRLELGTLADAQLGACMNCKQCEMACPAGVQITSMIRRARAESRAESGGKSGDRYIADTELLGKLGTLLPAAANTALKLKPVRKVMEAVLGVDAARPLPRFARHVYRVQPRHRVPPAAVPNLKKPVVLFTGCYARFYDPDLAGAVVEVLERNNFEVIIPPQMCCGLPFLANGYPEKAARNARFNLDHLDPYTRQNVPVIVASTSCALTLKSDYPELLGGGAAGFSGQVRELGDFLRELWESGELNLGLGRVDETLSYHEPCHLKALGQGRPFVELLRLIPGLRVVELDEGCCGLAGTYGVKQRHAATAAAIGKPLFDQVRRLGSRVITECETCKMQIESGAEIETLHPVKILRQAYRAAAAGTISMDFAIK